MGPLICITFAVMAAASADGVQVDVTMDPPLTPFHRTAAFTISVEAPADTEINLPDLAGHLGGLEVFGVPKHHTETDSEGRKHITKTYILDPVFTGDYPIEPVTVTWGDDQSLTVPAPMLRVRELTEEERTLAGQFDPALSGRPPLPGPASRWYTWALVAVLALAAAGVALWLWRKRASKAPELTIKPAWEIAYDRLRVLKKRKLPEAGKYETYYVDLSSILRYYIEGRFRIHAPERTTPEFLDEIRQAGMMTDEHEQFLETILQHCDNVKFAQYMPRDEQMGKSFAGVLRFVKETVPQIQPSEEEEAA